MIDAKQLSAPLNVLGTVAIGQESEMANSDEARRKNMQQKSSHEFDVRQLHCFRAMTITIVFPLKANSIIFHSK